MLRSHLVQIDSTAFESQDRECIGLVVGLMQPFAIRNALVVDADSDLKRLLVKILKPSIWAIQHVPTNQAALRAAKGKTFELIITSEKTSGREDVD